MRIFLTEAPFHEELAGAESEPQGASSLRPLAWLPASNQTMPRFSAGHSGRDRAFGASSSETLVPNGPG
jgi:hypothetical protein